jgi:hypothetical protein
MLRGSYVMSSVLYDPCASDWILRNKYKFQPPKLDSLKFHVALSYVMETLWPRGCAMTDLTITIRDVNGRMIKELQINGSDQEIVADISDLIPGFYSVQISSSNFDTTEKLIVQK